MKKTIISIVIALSACIASMGQNLTGKVTTEDGRPVKGVAVSDGYSIVKTDAGGFYALQSNKVNGYVFIEIPSGYEPVVSHAVAQFWANLNSTDPRIDEVHNFTLRKVRQSKFRIVALSDVHLAGRYNDREQFCADVIPVLRKYAEDHKNEKVYAFNTGDMTFDIYWYADRYAIEDYVKTMDVLKFPFTTYYANGNHDHDGATPEGPDCDFNALKRYTQVLGPSYYSLNIGQWHIIFLDSIYYKNEDLPTKKVFENIYGARNYDHKFDERQWEWLAKDLADVSESTPIMVCTHAPIFRNKGYQGKWEFYTFPEDQAQRFIDTFAKYKQVHIIDGHSHKNSVTYVGDNIVDHNIGSVCGTWWKCGNWGLTPMNTDASLPNFEEFVVNGTSLTWKYHSFLGGDAKQFIVYDMNEVKKAYREDPWLAGYVKATKEELKFLEAEDNTVWVKVYAWDPKWKVEILENNKPLEIDNVKGEDPFFHLNYGMAQYEDKGGSYAKKIKYPTHFFSAKVSSPNAKVTVKITDAFGNVYKENVKLPKAFGKDMK